MQGVGFRPFVYRLATGMGIAGWVVNDSHGVVIEIQSQAVQIKEFLRRLQSELPPLAKIARQEEYPAPLASGEAGFVIRPSDAGEMADAQVTVDTAVCEDCLREMNDPADRRYRYPFINCTNCGPRYSIVHSIPYDRPNTTMADFAMCALCGAEYSDPASRRFHAQPIACPSCGPAVWLVDTHGKQITCPDPIALAAEMLIDGKVVAIKGLGGFHLAVRADDDHAVRRLRERKHRDAKPLAVMVRTMEAARKLCQIDDEAERLLTSPLRPIVLLQRHAEAPIAASVAEGLDTLGLLLPYTPLHYLLLGWNLPPLVMTSGNYSDEPLVKDNDAAVSHLGQIADALLLHNRRIERRIDDSVLQARAGGSLLMRRARGYAPQPVFLDIPVESAGGSVSRQQEMNAAGAAPSQMTILAVGAELKSAVCLYRDGRAVLSEHIGDLNDGRTYRHFIDTISHLETLFEIRPNVIAADMHPNYLSTEYAARRHRGELAGRPAVALVRVQHHHAHIAACMAENGRSAPVIGLSCDGTGYGDDGASWGCEVLLADLRGYDRMGHLRYMPLIGGDAAASETWRPALAALHDVFGSDCLGMAKNCGIDVPEQRLKTALEMLEVSANCPRSSSLGRWFDTVAALTRLTPENRYEGQAPMLLEAAITPGVKEEYPFQIAYNHPFLIDLRPAVAKLVQDVTSGTPVGVVSARFHNTVASFLAASAMKAREQTSVNVVALSGGCFANRYLSRTLAERLDAAGFQVLQHHTIPCNDGGIALGQAVVAAAKTYGKNLISSYEVGGQKEG